MPPFTTIKGAFVARLLFLVFLVNGIHAQAPPDLKDFPSKTGPASGLHNVDSVLDKLLHEYESSGRRLQELDVPEGLLMLDDQLIVDIVGAPGATNQELRENVETMGLEVTGCFRLVEGACSVRAPLSELRNLASSSLVDFIHSDMVEQDYSGVIDSFASQSMFADDAVSEFGVTGTGITVGVLSDSFDTCTGCSKRAKDDVNSGDLPPWSRMVIARDYSGGSDEGRFHHGDTDHEYQRIVACFTQHVL